MPTITEAQRAKIEEAQLIVERALELAVTPQGRSQIDEVQFAFGYAEPGYSVDEAGLVATGNWNTVTKHEDGRFVDVDPVAANLGSVLEELGVALEWSDEWDRCSDCGLLVRTQADSYSWQRSYVESEDGIICSGCVKPADHLEALEGQDGKCNTIETIDPAEYGYVRIDTEFEHGLHRGQDADPKLIGKAVRAFGISRYLFQLDAAGQFDVRFSLYVHESEMEKFDAEKFKAAETDGPSVSGAMERGLYDAAAKMRQLPDGAGVKYAKIGGDGTAEVRIVSPEEFVKGIGR